MSNMIKHVKQYTVKEFQTQNLATAERRIADNGLFSIGSKRNEADGKSYPIRGRISIDNKRIYLYTVQKVRRKVARTPLAKPGKFGKKYTTEVLRCGHWKVRIFTFPMESVISAEQGKRTFRVLLK